MGTYADSIYHIFWGNLGLRLHICLDLLQIYDLAKDALSPVYYFVLPAGKVRDVSFIFLPSVKLMALMSSGGQIYTQPLDDSSSAKSGPFYLTNIVPVEHKDLNDTNGQIGGGGVSIYYSHGFQLLFFSYVQGTVELKCFFTNLSIKISTEQNKRNITVSTKFEFLKFFNAYVSMNLTCKNSNFLLGALFRLFCSILYFIFRLWFTLGSSMSVFSLGFSFLPMCWMGTVPNV